MSKSFASLVHDLGKRFNAQSGLVMTTGTITANNPAGVSGQSYGMQFQGTNVANVTAMAGQYRVGRRVVGMRMGPGSSLVQIIGPAPKAQQANGNAYEQSADVTDRKLLR